MISLSVAISNNAVKKFGEKVRSYRGKFGITQEELGFRSGLDRTYISGIERGLRNPSITAAARIAEAIGVPLIDLLLKPQKIYTFERIKYRSPEEITNLYRRKIDLLLQERDLNQLYSEEKQIYGKLRAASLYDPRLPDVYFSSPESARLGKAIAEKLEKMEEEEFLGSRYPYFWLSEIKDNFFKIDIEGVN
jgi:transcriptional regulator with XRE-family HTH domain